MVQRAGRVEGKVAIVTGAGSTPGAGIGTGKASAVVLAREGARVLLVDLHPERAEETKQIIDEEGGKAEVFAADVTRASECESMVKAAVENFGTVDILVNNIGLAALGTVVDTTEEAWDRTFDVNLRTAFLASKYAVPVMADKGAGAVVNIASISALRGDGTVAYSAAKGALIAMTVDMAYSHGRQGIRVNAIAPGHITTPMVHSVTAPVHAPSTWTRCAPKPGCWEHRAPAGTSGGPSASSRATRRAGSPASPFPSSLVSSASPP